MQEVFLCMPRDAIVDSDSALNYLQNEKKNC